MAQSGHTGGGRCFIVSLLMTKCAPDGRTGFKGEAQRLENIIQVCFSIFSDNTFDAKTYFDDTGEETFAMNPHCVQIFVYFKDAWREEIG